MKINTPRKSSISTHRLILPSNLKSYATKSPKNHSRIYVEAGMTPNPKIKITPGRTLEGKNNEGTQIDLDELNYNYDQDDYVNIQ